MHLSAVNPVGTKCLCHKSLPFAGMSIGTLGIIKLGSPKSATKFHASGSGRFAGCTTVSKSPYSAPLFTHETTESISSCDKRQSPCKSCMPIP